MRAAALQSEADWLPVRFCHGGPLVIYAPAMSDTEASPDSGLTDHGFEKVIPAVGIVCFRNSDVLLIRRGQKPLAGEWSLPGGRIEAGECAEDAALRELKEETRVEARIISLVDILDAIFTSRRSGDVTRHYLLVDYVAEWTGGEVIAGDDAAHAEWIPPERLETLELWVETRRVIAKAREIYLESKEG